MLKHILLLSLIITIFTSCTRNADLEKELIVFNEKKITQSRFIKSILQQGFLLFGKELVSNLKDKDVFQRIKQKTLEVELENIFIQHIADNHNIIIKNDELKNWIENRTKGLLKIELEYFLNYSNMSLKEWKSLFKNQLLKEKILNIYKLDTEKDLETAASGASEQQYKVQVLNFDSTVEAQNVYKELKAFPQRIDQILQLRKSTKTHDWISKKDGLLFEKASTLSSGGLSKPFETTWGHVIIKLLSSSQRPLAEPGGSETKTTKKPEKYLKKLNDFRENKALKIDLKSIYGLKLK